ncbi:MAG TPA: GAF domain-containing protein [Terriglobales bacterium]|nr:GAF domain-containing protein [Terriglobales bacterium]
MKRYRSPREVLADVERVLAARPSATAHASPLDEIVEQLHDARHYFWIGIYLVVGEQVVRQAFRGPVPPCHAFAFGVGNVGTTGQSGILKVIPDVSQDPTYSMCFLETKSEIVVPIKLGGKVLGVIDVESDRENAFGKTDRVLLEEVADRLARFLTKSGRYLLRHARESATASNSPVRAYPASAEKAVKSSGGRRAAAGAGTRS